MDKWNIYPDDPLPMYGQRVLIWNPRLKEVRIAYYFRPENNKSLPTFEEWENGKQIYVFPRNTYWMPLPTPPLDIKLEAEVRSWTLGGSESE